jgi:hypothetical protein
MGQPTNWHQLAGAPEAISTDYPHHAGVYQDGDKLLAVNRAAAEDQAAVLADDRVTSLFKDLDFTRVDDRAGSLAGLIQEIWRPFLVVMLIALLVEAALCLPRRAQQSQNVGSALPRPSRVGDEPPLSSAVELSRAKV